MPDSMAVLSKNNIILLISIYQPINLDGFYEAVIQPIFQAHSHLQSEKIWGYLESF